MSTVYSVATALRRYHVERVDGDRWTVFHDGAPVVTFHELADASDHVQERVQADRALLRLHSGLPIFAAPPMAKGSL